MLLLLLSNRKEDDALLVLWRRRRHLIYAAFMSIRYLTCHDAPDVHVKLLAIWLDRTG